MHTRKLKPHWFAQADRTQALLDTGDLSIRQLEKLTGVDYRHLHEYIVSRKREPRADIAFHIRYLTDSTLMGMSGAQITAWEKVVKTLKTKRK